MKTFYSILIFLLLIKPCKSQSKIELSEITNNFPVYENFKNTFTNRFQAEPGGKEFRTSTATICYYKVNTDSLPEYSYHYVSDTSLTMMFDGKNYLRLHHYNKTYIFGDDKHRNIHSFKGNIFAIKQMLNEINTDTSFNYEIKHNKQAGKIEVEFTVKTLLFLDIPIMKWPSDKIDSTRIKVVLDDKTFYPISYSNWAYTKDNKSQLIDECLFEKPVMIEPQIISAIDSIPPEYIGDKIIQKKTTLKFEGSDFPEFVMKTIDGSNLSTEDLSGDVILYDFFALWCAPCLYATDYLVELKNNINSEMFNIVCVDAVKHSNIDKLRIYKEQKKIEYPIIVDGESLMLKLDVTSLPTFVLVDKSNKIVRYQKGFSENLIKELQNEIKGLLRD